jgi:hypothetical protein
MLSRLSERDGHHNSFEFFPAPHIHPHIISQFFRSLWLFFALKVTQQLCQVRDYHAIALKLQS